MPILSKVKKCPRCKEDINDKNWLVLAMRLETVALLPVNPVTNIAEEDPQTITNGYADAEEYIAKMLSPVGKPTIHGCESCSQKEEKDVNPGEAQRSVRPKSKTG